jgi:hypothetical protein
MGSASAYEYNIRRYLDGSFREESGAGGTGAGGSARRAAPPVLDGDMHSGSSGDLSPPSTQHYVSQHGSYAHEQREPAHQHQHQPQRPQYYPAGRNMASPSPPPAQQQPPPLPLPPQLPRTLNGALRRRLTQPQDEFGGGSSGSGGEGSAADAFDGGAGPDYQPLREDGYEEEELAYIRAEAEYIKASQHHSNSLRARQPYLSSGGVGGGGDLAMNPLHSGASNGVGKQHLALPTRGGSLQQGGGCRHTEFGSCADCMGGMDIIIRVSHFGGSTCRQESADTWSAALAQALGCCGSVTTPTSCGPREHKASLGATFMRQPACRPHGFGPRRTERQQ